MIARLPTTDKAADQFVIGQPEILQASGFFRGVSFFALPPMIY